MKRLHHAVVFQIEGSSYRLRKAAIGGHDHGALFVTRVDKSEEQIAAAGYHWEVADLVDDQQREAFQLREKAFVRARPAVSASAAASGLDPVEGCAAAASQEERRGLLY
jgi:hypothetical protein